MDASVSNVGLSASTLLAVFLNPGTNPRVALMLYAAIGVALLILLVIGILVVMSGSDDEASGPTEEPTLQPRPSRAVRLAPPTSPGGRIALALWALFVVGCVWLAAGVTTSDPALCKSCHWPASAHAKAADGSDPHADVTCVSCHETGGVIARYVTGVPLRVLHLATTTGRLGGEAEYGAVASRSCSACHSAALAGKQTNAARGLKMSHAEPLSAGAGCLDCHEISGGVVSVHNAGMKPCLRCHDDKSASSACETCHVKNAAAAARARTTSFQNAQIRDVSCGGCHDEKKSCDPCHGMRMPHTKDFMGGTHARAASVDIWFNNGRECGRCHGPTRHPCTGCHTDMMGKAHGTTPWLAETHQGAQASGCDTCHKRYARVATRNFCKDVCHSPAAIAASPR